MLTVLNEQIKCLQMILSADMIDTSEGKKQLHMLKEKAVKNVHHYAFNQRADGRFVTKMANGSQMTGGTYKNLIDKLYEFYFGSRNASLASLYPEWIEYRLNESPAKEKTIKEDQYVWNSLLKGKEITLLPLRSLEAPNYIVFFRSITKNRTLTRKRFNNMKSIMNGIIYYAIEKGIIIHNPLSEIDYRKFTYKPENNSIMPYTEEERFMILDHLKDEEDLYSLAIRLQFHLTLRIGELKGLRFDDVYGNYIHICRLMNYKNEIEEDIKGHASEGIRWLPLPDEALRIIQKIKDSNPDSPYMFIKDSVTLTTGTYNDHLKKCCTELNIPYRSSHKVRFSTASILYHEGVTLPELQNMLGHTTLAMTTHYIKKISTNDSVLQKVNSVFSKNCMHL